MNTGLKVLIVWFNGIMNLGVILLNKRIQKFYIIMLITVIAVAFVAYFMSRSYRETYLKELDKDLAENVSEYTNVIENEIKDIIVLVESHGKVFSTNGLLHTNNLAELFRLVNQKSGAISSMYFIYNSDGSGANSNGFLDRSEIGTDLRKKPWYINAVKAEETVVTGTYNDNRNQKPVLTISYAVRSGAQLQGVLAIDVYLETLREHLEKITTWRNTYNYVLDSKGTVVLHPLEENLGFSFSDTSDQRLELHSITREHFNKNLFRIWDTDFSKIDEGFVEYFNLQNKKVHAVYERIPELKWTIVSAYDYDEIREDTVKYDLLISFLSIMVLLFIGLIIYYLLVWSGSIDPVTRTFNTNKMKELIKNRLDNNKKYIVLYIDLRNLAAINDKYGVSGGDRILFQYGKVMQKKFKEYGFMGTTKRKNFICIFKNNDWDSAVAFASKLHRDLDSLSLVVDKSSIPVESFIGLTELRLKEISELDQELESIEELFIELKRSGSDSPLISMNFNELVNEKKAEVKLKDDLLIAIKSDKIVPFFQPIYSMKSGALDKFEVLMRIQDRDEFLSPYPYIAIAEKYNKIGTVDLIVISKALEYKRRYDKNDEVKLSINISGKVLHDGNFMEKVVEKIDELGVNHSNITFEITETYNINEVDRLVDMISKYKKSGFKFSIDDFGTGFSSMYYLKHIPADYLKIDGSFIKDIDTNRESYHVVQSIVSMAKAFNIKTVAEFVENQSVEEIIKQMGVDYGQGYYFGKPEGGFNYIR